MEVVINCDSDTVRDVIKSLSSCLVSDLQFDFLTDSESSVLYALKNCFEIYLHDDKTVLTAIYK